MRKSLPIFGSERGYETIHKLRALTKDKVDKDVIDRSYKMLDILDGKANSLLRVNGLLGFAQLALVLLSVFLCFLIVQLRRRFLAHVHKNANGLYEFGDATYRLANVLDDRTHYYWAAWWCTLLAVFLLPLFWLLSIIASLMPLP